ncbi:MAG: thiamine phosphate synthase [bacterium]
MKQIDFQLYLITDRKQVRNQDLLSALDEALEGGVRAVQLREKDLSDRELFELGRALRTLTRNHGARLFINDRADLAVAVEADGVHLTQTSYSAREARKIVGSDRLIGVSTHSLEQVRKAEDDGADFVTLGPIFATPSKMEYGHPLGLPLLEKTVRQVNVPVFAIGGIKKQNALSVLDAGAHGIALISGILATPDLKQAAGEFVSILHGTHPIEDRHAV